MINLSNTIIDLNIDDVIDDSVLTSNTETIAHLTPVSVQLLILRVLRISFFRIFRLSIYFVETLDLTSNHSLIELICSENLIEDIHLSKFCFADYFCDDNQLTEMDAVIPKIGIIGM